MSAVGGHRPPLQKMSILRDVDLATARVLVITGAGVSAESGIPTFRGKDGYWRNLDPMKLATPEAFTENPELVWEWYNERREKICAAQPNAAHKAIVDLAQCAREFLLVTQNVDDLHARTGLPNEKMVQIHGDIFETRCSRCDFKTTTAESPRAGELDRFNRSSSQWDNAATASSSATDRLNRSVAQLPRCVECGALMRPGVVWFGEMLDPGKIDMVEEFLSRGDVDLALVVGTTAVFGYITDWATRASRVLIEINPEETPLSEVATQTIRERAGIALPRIVDSLR